MNPSMWLKALKIIPRIDKKEWERLDILSRWLIATRAAVLIMTFISAALAGIFAFRVNAFSFWPWLLLTLGLVLAHATNNLLNDFTDYSRGIDQDNYYRAQYGPQPLVHGLLNKKQLLTYIAVTGLFALTCGLALISYRGGITWILIALGAFFVLFYTWPLKFIGMGEIAVLIVWGPLMIGGGYYVLTGSWDWTVVAASLPYALGVTTVIFGKHIDKAEIDRDMHIHTLPVIIGEKAARICVVIMFFLQYVLTIALVLLGYFTPVMLAVIFALPTLREIWPMFKSPKPSEKPADYPDIWPNYFVASGFYHNRSFGMVFLLALLVDTVIRLL